MKKNYFEPEMNIAVFDSEDVVTTSGVTGKKVSLDSTVAEKSASVSYQDFLTF